jgi:hypothetical protein
MILRVNNRSVYGVMRCMRRSVPRAEDTVSIVKQLAFAKQARLLPLAVLTQRSVSHIHL